MKTSASETLQFHEFFFIPQRINLFQFALIHLNWATVYKVARSSDSEKFLKTRLSHPIHEGHIVSYKNLLLHSRYSSYFPYFTNTNQKTTIPLINIFSIIAVKSKLRRFAAKNHTPCASLIFRVRKERQTPRVSRFRFFRGCSAWTWWGGGLRAAQKQDNTTFL